MDTKGTPQPPPPPPNPNPNHPAFLASASPSRPMLAFHFLRALSRIHRATSVPRRTRTIRRAAYSSMACATSPRRAWSRALLRQARSRRSRASPRRALLLRRSVVAGAAQPPAARSSTTAGETSAGAGSRAPPRQAEEPPRADALRRLVPGGAGMEYCSLLEETADYVCCLREQVFVSENGIKFVRIDGSTLPRERKEAVDSFRFNAEVKVAIIGITAGGVGLDFSSAQNVVFLELPKSASELVQSWERLNNQCCPFPI